MSGAITGTTGILGIIGWPVEHSLSPLMQNEALRRAGLDLVYVPFPVHPDALEEAVKGLRALGVCGFNVTVPHKTAVIPCLDELTPEAEMCGAVNTVRRDDDRLIGHNTDGIGLVRSLADDLGFRPPGRTVLVLGAGGAARGAVLALAAAGISRMIVANRTLRYGEELCGLVRLQFPHLDVQAISLDMSAIKPVLGAVDLLLNTTSVGMSGTAFAGLDLTAMHQSAAVYDMVYAPPCTPLLEEARRHGLCCANGLGMLACQGEEAFSFWTGRPPHPGLMKSCLHGHIGATTA